MLSERIKILRNDVMSRECVYELGHNWKCGSWIKNANPWARDIALINVPENGLSVVQKRARLLKELVQISKVEIYPQWTLAGEHLEGHSFSSFNEKADKSRLKEYGFDESCIDEIKKHCAAYRRYEFVNVGEDDFESPGKKDLMNSVYLARGWIENHSIRDYAKLIKTGYGGIKDEILARLDSTPIDAPGYVTKSNFWKAALCVCDAGILLGEKYAELAENMAGETNDCTEKSRLLKMAETCRKVPVRGAETFFEAVQSLWFGHILTCGEDGVNANSLGRIDQFLYPYFKADMDAGRIDREKALDIMLEFACKMYQDYDVQAITLSGMDSDGKDKTNELTYIILEATEKLGFIRDVSVRLHENSPEKLLKTCVRMVARGGGIPFIFNDECFIKALEERGIDRRDACDYAPIGCIELTIPGKANPHAVSSWFNAAKCMELAIHNGKDPVSGELMGLETGAFDSFSCFEEFFGAYKKQVEYFVPRMVCRTNRGELMQRERGPLPCWSILTDDCIERGKDITDGGAIYNYHSVCLLGAANVADSMYAVKKLVFDRKKISPGILSDALQKNYDGYENIRLMLLNEAEKYGNDNEDVDRLAADVCNHFIDLMDKAESPLGGRYFTHLFSFILNVSFGKVTGASPDGRGAGEPLAYSLSAQQGRDKEGITAMLKSLSKLPHERAAGASAAIVDISSDLIKGEDGVSVLYEIFRTAVKMGVGQLQMNAVTEERLKKAKDDPEKYGNIPVRVAGYSQIFKLLNEDLQDLVIARTKHSK